MSSRSTSHLVYRQSSFGSIISIVHSIIMSFQQNNSWCSRVCDMFVAHSKLIRDDAHRRVVIDHLHRVLDAFIDSSAIQGLFWLFYVWYMFAANSNYDRVPYVVGANDDHDGSLSTDRIDSDCSNTTRNVSHSTSTDRVLLFRIMCTTSHRLRSNIRRRTSRTSNCNHIYDAYSTSAIECSLKRRFVFHLSPRISIIL